MWKFTKCSKCWREFMWFSCPNWCNKPEPVKPQPIIIHKPVKIIQPVTENEINKINLPKYTASYLNNKLKINYYSIKNEICCIKVWDKYILHEDIIAYYKLSLQDSLQII